MPEQVDVVIAGAGPAGIVAALHLARAGISVAVLEAGATPAEDLRASTLHPPTLDYLATLGLSEELHATGLQSPEYRYINRRSGAFVSFDLTEIADVSVHPYRLQCEQWKLTGFGCRALAAHDHATLAFRHGVTGFAQDDDGVTVFADTPDGPAQFRGRYLIACDGAASVVRKQTGIAFAGFTYEEKFLCLSTAMEMRDFLPGICNVNYMADPAEWLVLLRAPTAWRVLVPAALATPDEELLSDAKRDRVFGGLLGPDRPVETLHRTIYRVHQRVADRYRQGRVLLVGDAAHLNNPLGGFGMNAALHDVRNLCGKLIAVLRDGGREELFDLYERQRRTVMQEFIQAQTIRNKQAMEMSAAEGAATQERELRTIAADPVQRRAYLLRQSMYASVEREQSIT